MTKKEKEITRHYRLVHQIVSLTGINFQAKKKQYSIVPAFLAVIDSVERLRLGSGNFHICIIISKPSIRKYILQV